MYDTLIHGRYLYFHEDADGDTSRLHTLHKTVLFLGGGGGGGIRVNELFLKIFPRFSLAVKLLNMVSV